LIDNDEPNAFAFGNGSVYILKGLFKTITSDNELAFVIAHEISHVILKHSAKSVEYQNRMNLSNKDSKVREFSREQEFEADKFGILFSIRAGYSPLGSVNWFNKMTSLGYEYPPLYVDYTDHPNFTQRVVQAFIHIGTYYEYAKNFDYGMLYLSMGNYDEAAESFSKFLEKYPRYKEAYNNIGVALLLKKLNSKNIDQELWLSSAISKVQLFSDNFDKPVRGSYSFKTRDFSEALEYFEEAIKYDEKYPQPYINLAMISIYIKDYEKAQDYLNKAIKLDKNSIDALSAYGFLYAEMDQFNDAVEYFKKVIKLNEKDPQGYFNLAYLYQWDNKKALAIETWKKVIELLPDGKYSDKAKDNLAFLETGSRIEISKKEYDRKKDTPRPSAPKIAGIQIGDQMNIVQALFKTPYNKKITQQKELWEYTNPTMSVGFNTEGKVNYILLLERIPTGTEFINNININSEENELLESFGKPEQTFSEGIYLVHNYKSIGLTFWILNKKVTGIAIYQPNI
jgi:predicted Zn-dependent protease